MIQKGFEIRDTLRDAGKIGLMVHPTTAQFAASVPMALASSEKVLGSAQRYGAEQAYKLLGDEENANRVAQQPSPDFASLVQKYYSPLMATSPSGKAIQQPALKFLAESFPAVPSGPRGSGFGQPAPTRPILTPDDARALLGEANRVATQVRDIPTDFQNAQSGFTRLDPITNKPTYGAKLQRTADSIAETMERREMQGLTPIPGLPAELQPQTRFYAVRPDKSQAIVPKVPPTVSADLRIDPFDQQRRAAVTALDSLDLGDRQQTTRQYVNRYLSTAPDEVKQALRKFNEEDLRRIFPDMARIGDAQAAAEALYSDPVAKEQRQRDLLNRFAQAHPEFKLPTFDEHQQRVSAVQSMMQDQFVPWVSKHLGTPSDPQLLLAQEGKTIVTPESLFESEANNPLTIETEQNRMREGFPAAGTSYEKGVELQSQLDQAKQVADVSQQVHAAQQSAAGPGESAHLMFPDFDQNRIQAEKDAAVVRDLEQKIENNKIGQVYEDLADQSITPYEAAYAQSIVEPQNRQFYPKLMKQGADQKVYQIGAGPLDTMALGKRVAEDIMSGKIPLDLVPKLTDFTPMARKYAEEQAKNYQARKEELRNYVGNANARFLDIVSHVPNDRVFGKLGAIFLDDSLSFDDIDKLASQDTAILDHCIGEAGQTKYKSKLTGRKHGWTPMYDPATGEKNPHATRTHTRYAEKIVDGRYIVASLRDTETGYPITTISWSALNDGKWITEYLSGFNNNEAISPEYRDSVKAFLNAANEGTGSEQLRNFRLDSISDLENRYALFDKDNKQSMSFARASLSTPNLKALKDNPDVLRQLPRFFNRDDLNNAIALPTPSANAREPDNVRALMQARSILAEELDNLYGSAPISEIQTMVDDINHEIADIDARLARAQSQPVAAPTAQQRQAPTSITRDDVVRTLVETQLAIDPEAVGLQNLVFSGTVDFDPNNSLQSLRNVRQYLTQHVSDTINNNQAPARTIDALNAVVSNGMIPRLNELIAELSPAPVAPVAPVPQLTPRQQIARDRAPQIARLFIEFSDPALETPTQLRALAARLASRGESRIAANDIAAIGDSLGNLVLRASDFNPSNLALVSSALRDRADALEQPQPQPAPVAPAAVQRNDAHPYGFTQETLGNIRADLSSSFSMDNNPVWRRDVLPILAENWDSDYPSSSIEMMISDIEYHMREINPNMGDQGLEAFNYDEAALMDHYAGLEELKESILEILDNTRQMEDRDTRQLEAQGAQAAAGNQMSNIRSDQAANMSYAELAAAVGDPARYDDITGRAIREIRLNDRDPSEVIQEIIDGRQIGNHNLMSLTPVERELISRDVSDTIRALSAATAAPRTTLRQDMVSAYVTALQHPDPQVSSSLYAIRNMLDSITIDAQGRGEDVNSIGNELLNDLGERIRNVGGLVDRRETVGGLTMQQTDQFLQGLMQAREQIAQTFIRNAEQEAAQQPAQQPQAQTPDIGDFIQTLRRDVSMQVAERVETVAFRVAENINPRANPLEYAQSLRQAANTEDSMQVEVSLHELADEFEAAHIRTQLDNWEPEDAVPNAPPPVDAVDLARGPSEYVQSIQPTINNLANELMYDDMSPDGVPNVPAIESTIFALRNGTIDHAAFRAMPEAERQNAMNAVADDIDNRLIRNTPPVVDDNVYIDDEQAGLIIDDEMRNVFRNYGQDVGERVSRAIEDMADHMSFADDPHGVIQHLRRNTIVGRNGSLEVRANAELAMRDIAQRLENEFNAEFNARAQPQQLVAQSRTIPQSIRGMSTNEMTAQLPATSVHNTIALAAQITSVNTPDEIRNITQLVRQYAIGGWEDFIPMQREYLARYLERYVEENPEPPQRRGPFQPGGSSAVRGLPLGNLNIRPSITAQSLRGPDSQTVSNFLQQVRSLPGVTQEGLSTGLMAFENMDPSRRMTKAEFVRELLPSSYDIVSLQGAADDNVHYRDMAEAHVSEDPESVLNEMGVSDRYHGEILDVVVYDAMPFEDLSSGAKKALRKKNITDYDSLYSAHAEAFRALVENGMEYLADMDGTQVTDENGFRYANNQRLVLKSSGDDYSEFGVTHPDQQGTYHHFANAPEGLIGHVRGTYNPDGLEIKTTDADIFTTKPNSYVIEEIQSDAQKNSQQVAHLHQVHGVLFKAAIQKALESGADVVYLPTAKVIASERPGAGGHEPRTDERTGLVTMVPIKKDTTSKFKPIYDQAIVKEGLKPLLKIPGVKSTLVSNGDYHEITFTPEAKERILNGPGQTVPGYKKGGRVHTTPSVDQMKFELMMRRA